MEGTCTEWAWCSSDGLVLPDKALAKNSVILTFLKVPSLYLGASFYARMPFQILPVLLLPASPIADLLNMGLSVTLWGERNGERKRKFQAEAISPQPRVPIKRSIYFPSEWDPPISLPMCKSLFSSCWLVIFICGLWVQGNCLLGIIASHECHTEISRGAPFSLKRYSLCKAPGLKISIVGMWWPLAAQDKLMGQLA